MNKIKTLLASLMLVITLAFTAQAQVTPTTLITALTNAFTIGGAASTNISASGRPIEVYQGKGFGVQAIYTGGSSIYTTGLVSIGYSLSIDGTNYSTATGNMIWQHFVPNGVTTVYAFTNFPATLTDNARYVKLHTITNGNTATNMAAFLTNVFVGRRP